MVDRISSAGPQFQPDAGRANKTGEHSPVTENERAEQPGREQVAAARSDSVELSEAARALANGGVEATGKVEGSTLSPDRLRTISERINSGFYDRPEIQNQIADKIAQDIRANPNG